MENKQSLIAQLVGDAVTTQELLDRAYEASLDDFVHFVRDVVTERELGRANEPSKEELERALGSLGQSLAPNRQALSKFELATHAYISRAKSRAASLNFKPLGMSAFARYESTRAQSLAVCLTVKQVPIPQNPFDPNRR